MNQIRKTAQLCRQVHERLDLVLAGDLEDPALEGAWVLEVLPESSSSVLVQIVCPPDVSPADTRAALERAGPYLRSEVAGAIHRKRTPHLKFIVVVQPGGSEEAPHV